jgi:hypothetical protein
MSRRIRIPALVRSFLVGTCLAAASSVSLAATYSCTGSVGQVTVGPNGTVNASFIFSTGNMYSETVCNLDTATSGVSPTTCRSILATLTAARLAERSVTLWFDNATGSSCSLADWSALANHGWYWGPMIQ